MLEKIVIPGFGSYGFNVQFDDVKEIDKEIGASVPGLIFKIHSENGISHSDRYTLMTKYRFSKEMVEALAKYPFQPPKNYMPIMMRSGELKCDACYEPQKRRWFYYVNDIPRKKIFFGPKLQIKITKCCNTYTFGAEIIFKKRYFRRKTKK